MHVKDIAARYEAAVKQTHSPISQQDNDKQVDTDHVGTSGHVKKIRDRLEQAVKDAQLAEEPSTTSTISSSIHQPTPVKTHSPRAVDAAQFEDAKKLHAVVPQSVADVGDNHLQVSQQVQPHSSLQSLPSSNQSQNSNVRNQILQFQAEKEPHASSDKVTSLNPQTSITDNTSEQNKKSYQLQSEPSLEELQIINRQKSSSNEEKFKGVGSLVHDIQKRMPQHQTSTPKPSAHPQENIASSKSRGTANQASTHSVEIRTGSSRSYTNYDGSGYEYFTCSDTRSSLDLIEPIEHVSDDDLDNIDGAERVEDFDSQDTSLDSFQRHGTVEFLDDETPSSYSPQEYSGDDVELDGYRQQPVVEVDDTESDHDFNHESDQDFNHESDHDSEQVSERSISNCFLADTSTAFATEFMSQTSLERDAITSVEDTDGEDSSDGFASADEDFTRPSPIGWRSRSSARRPRVRSMGIASVSNPGIGRAPSVSTGVPKSNPLMRNRLSSQHLPSSGSPSRSGMTRVASLNFQGGGVARHVGDRSNPTSFKRLPKAKVMIARRRGHSLNLPDRYDDPQPNVHATLSMDEGSLGARRLVREYSNPSELMTGQVSMVEVSNDDDLNLSDRKQENVPPITGGGLLRQHKRENEFKKRYDEFMDAEDFGDKRQVVSDEDFTLEADVPSGSSKQRYKHRMRIFGKSAHKDKEKLRTERRERHAEMVSRRSEILSGALDRVSMAADPWIDFITDANALPSGRRPLRDVMKKLFRRRGNDMIKN